jgi:hypothetical protein
MFGKFFPQNGPQICNVSGLKSAIWAGVYVIKHKTCGKYGKKNIKHRNLLASTEIGSNGPCGIVPISL